MKEEAGISLEDREKWFTMHFDGACSKEGVGAGVTISTPYYIEQTSYSYKFYFSCTNNVAKYEALISGIHILKKLQARKVYIYMDILSLY
jgi:ribonuclease HI